MRFGVITSHAPDGRAWRERARLAEALGYSTLLMPDHFQDQWAHPKVCIGGGGKKMLSLAARAADIVAVNATMTAGELGTEVAATAARAPRATHSAPRAPRRQDAASTHFAARVAVWRLRVSGEGKVVTRRECPEQSVRNMRRERLVCPMSGVRSSRPGYAVWMTYEREPNASATSPGLNDAPVVDIGHQLVGRVTDVLFDDREFAPRWAVVKTGLFGGEHFVPLHNSYVDEAGRLVVPFDKMSIKHAPKTRGDHVLSPEIAKELRDYYGVAA
jgi:hypothetical protein